MKIDEYFDKVYVLNLNRRPERMDTIDRRMKFCNIEYEKFGATDGGVMHKVWKSLDNPFFKNPNYLGCAISHLSIYNDAIEKGYNKILIIEDDSRIKMNANKVFEEAIKLVPEDWNELLYLGFIPLSDDCSRWDYTILNSQFINSNIAIAKNSWGLYGYGISNYLMMETLEKYREDFPMELDRYFVTEIQPRNRSYAIVPQLFAADDGLSDNSGHHELGMLERSIDTRLTKLTDYI